MSRARMLSRRQAAEWQATKCLGCDRLIQPKQTPKGFWYITEYCSKPCAGRQRQKPRRVATCAFCGKRFSPTRTEESRGRRRKYCSKRCSDRAMTDPLGTIRKQNGYLVFNTGKAEVPVHRIVMEGVLGRPLTTTETVHHINGQRDDNRPENLELWDHAQPHGQRVSDKLAWCATYLTDHGFHVTPPPSQA